ncbi:MAG: ABC-2 transporter permease [Candidatus Niameybacter stercoravium]|nr:ABC-2 transporter permease [Candidatus Niameybacter stercoravium]
MSTTTLLIRKELMYLFRNLKFTWITTLILVLVFAVVYPGANLVACIIGPYMLVYGVMAHEEQSHSDVLNYTLPVSRRELCRSKYLLGMIYTLGVAIGVLGILAIGMQLTPTYYEVFRVLGIFNVLYILIGGALTYTALIIPIIYKFGCIKMRMIMVLTYGVVFGISFSVTNILKEVIPQVSEDINFSLIGGCTLTIGILAYVISYLISLNILKNKEYK